MFEKLSPEYLVSKRIRSFLLHMATAQNIDPRKARLLFKSSDGNVSIHLYEGGRHVKVLSLSGILEFFGQDYQESHAVALNTYLQQVSAETLIELPNLYIIICEAKEVVGAHVYEGGKYRKKMAILDLVTHFLQSQDE